MPVAPRLEAVGIERVGYSSQSMLLGHPTTDIHYKLVLQPIHAHTLGDAELLVELLETGTFATSATVRGSVSVPLSALGFEPAEQVCTVLSSEHEPAFRVTVLMHLQHM